MAWASLATLLSGSILGKVATRNLSEPKFEKKRKKKRHN